MNSKLYIPIAGICSVLVVSNLYLLIPVINELRTLFLYNTEEISIISSAYSLFYALGFLVWGLVNIKIGSKKTILYGLMGLSIITVLFSLTMNRDNFLIYRALQGLLASSFAPSIINLISSSVSSNKKGFAIGFISCTFMIAGIAGQIMSSFVVRSFGICRLFLYLGLSYGMFLIILNKILPEDKRDIVKINFIEQIKNYPGVILNRELIRLYVLSLTLLFSFVIYVSVIPLSVRYIGLIGIIISPFTNYITKKQSYKEVIKWCYIISLISITLLFFNGITIMLIVSSVLFNMSISAIIPLVIRQVGERGGDKRYLAISFNAFILFIGATAGNYLSVTLPDDIVNIPRMFIMYVILLSGMILS